MKQYRLYTPCKHEVSRVHILHCLWLPRILSWNRRNYTEGYCWILHLHYFKRFNFPTSVTQLINFKIFKEFLGCFLQIWRTILPKSVYFDRFSFSFDTVWYHGLVRRTRDFRKYQFRGVFGILGGSFRRNRFFDDLFLRWLCRCQCNTR